MSTVRGFGRFLSWTVMVAASAGMIGVSCASGGGSPAPATARSGGGEDGLAQAERGGPLYVQHCAKCHGDAGQGSDKAPPVVGANALPLDPPEKAKYRKAQFRTAGDVFEFVKANMPPGDSGKLSEAEYLDVMAFALKANGIDLAGKHITPDSLSGIVLHP